MFTLSYWSLSETETDLIAVCWDILYKTPLCRRSKIQYISIPSSWSAFFSRVILASRLLQAALTDSKVERMRKAGIFSLYKHKGPRSLQVNGEGILVTTYCVTTYCHILASFAAFAVSVLKRLSVLYSVAKTVLLPRTWRVIEYHRFWLKGQRTEGFFGSLVLPFFFPVPVNLTQSDSIWFNLIQLQHHSVLETWPLRFSSDAGANATFVRKSGARFWCLGSQRSRHSGFWGVWQCLMSWRYWESILHVLSLWDV